MKVFVTGSTGLLGNNLICLLNKEGYHVKALVRSKERAEKLLEHRTNVTFVEGDMLDVNGFAEQLEECDILFHAAAYFREYYQPGDHWQYLENVNIKGTMNLLTKAEQCGVKKLFT